MPDLYAELERELADVCLVDIREDLPRRERNVVYRSLLNINSATKHYNGPPTSVRPTRDSEVAYYKSIAQYHLDKVWGTDGKGRDIKGHGVMYHLGVGPSGTPYLLRDLETVLWHCANQIGNGKSLAVQSCLGGAQDATSAQWETTCRIFDIAGRVLGFDRAAVRGHREWPKYQYVGGSLVQVYNSPCPGPLLMKRLELYRRGPEAVQYCVTAPAGLRVRQGPGTSFPVALAGKARMPLGHRFVGDTISQGEAIEGDPRWVHRIDALGFMPMAWLATV